MLITYVVGKKLRLLSANNKDADQPARPRRLLCVFIFRISDITTASFVRVKLECAFDNGVAPITQVIHVRNRNSNIQVRPHNVIKVFLHTIRNCS